MTVKDIEPYSYLIFTHTGAEGLALTLPATSSMFQILPEIDSQRSWTIKNASTTDVLTITAGDGMDLVGIDANADTIADDGYAELTCTRIIYDEANDEEVACIVKEHLDVD